MIRQLAISAPTAAGASILFAGTALAAESVPIPPEYVYDPNLEPVTLHDYCTKSADEPNIENHQGQQSVDFRGPCAPHDLCYAGTASKDTCDNGFHDDMVQQCEATFGGDTTGYVERCKAAANTYYIGVDWFGDAE